MKGYFSKESLRYEDVIAELLEGWQNLIMKILLVNPPSEFLVDDNVFPTLGLLYLASYLKQNGYSDISLLDLNGKSDSKVKGAPKSQSDSLTKF